MNAATFLQAAWLLFLMSAGCSQSVALGLEVKGEYGFFRVFSGGRVVNRGVERFSAH